MIKPFSHSSFLTPPRYIDNICAAHVDMALALADDSTDISDDPTEDAGGQVCSFIRSFMVDL